jgi:hypothetical protein
MTNYIYSKSYTNVMIKYLQFLLILFLKGRRLGVSGEEVNRMSYTDDG